MDIELEGMLKKGKETGALSGEELDGLLEKLDLPEAELERIGAFAATAASLSTQRRGGIPSIVPEETVRRALGWEADGQ